MNKPLLFFFVCLLFSCQSESTEKCKYGTPVAIFSKNIPEVIQHNFSSTGQAADEQVVFKSGLTAEIEQSGCNNIKQQFQFTLERIGEGEPNWFLLAAEQFGYMGGLSADLQPLQMWASVIDSNASVFKLGEALEVDSGFFIKIDKINSGSKTILIVELSERTN